MSLPLFLQYLFVMAFTTYLVRAIPFILIRKKIKNRLLNAFLHYIPYTVLAAMTFPAILHSTGSLLSSIAGFAVAVFSAYRERSLVVVALEACAAVFLVERLMDLLPL